MYLSPFLFSSCFMVLAVTITRIQGAIVVPPTTMPFTMGGLSIESNVKEVTPGITNHLTVNCTFTKSSNPQVVSLVSLIISRWDKPTESLQEILTITSMKPNKVTELHQTRGTVDGSLDQNGDAYLSIVWDFPGQHVATKYNCEYHGLDMVGHPLGGKVGLEVGASDTDLTEIVEELRYLKEWKASQVKLTNILNNSQEHQNKVFDELERVIASQNHTIDVLTKTLKQQEQVIATQEDLQKTQTLTLQGLKSWVLEYITTFKTVMIQESGVVIDNQRLYWAKRNMNFKQAQTLCWINGGKLAEFTFEKLKAAESQLKADGMSDWHYIGLIRKDSNSPWSWASDGRNAGPVTFRDNPPSSHNCGTFHPDFTGYDTEACPNSGYYALCTRPL